MGNLPNVFIVADGMGGHNAGDYASKVTVETMLAEMQSSLKKSHADFPQSDRGSQ